MSPFPTFALHTFITFHLVRPIHCPSLRVLLVFTPQLFIGMVMVIMIWQCDWLLAYYKQTQSPTYSKLLLSVTWLFLIAELHCIFSSWFSITHFCLPLLFIRFLLNSLMSSCFQTLAFYAALFHCIFLHFSLIPRTQIWLWTLRRNR
jgi:hypothetical protein